MARQRKPYGSFHFDGVQPDAEQAGKRAQALKMQANRANRFCRTVRVELPDGTYEVYTYTKEPPT